ncbi:sigma 54 modulation/S30EA ribosomal C-terminal domain-containing protein [Kitasatospora sp. HPMI-4]|uniref:sigma 54 modulation/S30EA ribosomal C-terminal domain-containing protein n=1 Tax=Kitasatospora sp. HPMI-4 TaxID=3448443 RepID=UPI003F1C008E
MVNKPMTGQTPEVRIEIQGDLPPGTAESARSAMLAVLGEAPEPVLSARIRLTRMADPAAERPFLAQANLDVNGRLARAHVAAGTMTEALDLLHDRIVLQLARLSRHSEVRREGVPESDEYKRLLRTEPTHRPHHCPRPAELREVVRHKSVPLPRETPDQAAFEMDAMDYGFRLFSELTTGEDSVLYRAAPTGYRLAQVHPRQLGAVAIPLTVSPFPAPRLNLVNAKRRMDTLGQPFVFFTDDITGRGNVLYRRYDGHYGLITPAE